jgi:hypothetical protein
MNPMIRKRMRISFKPSAIVAALVMAFLLTSLTGTATALRSIQIEGAAGEIPVSGLLKFSQEGGLELASITCKVTLLRTISTIIPKRTGVLIGRVTGVAIDRGTPEATHCTLRSIRTLEEVSVLPGPHRELGAGVLLYSTVGPNELWKLIYDSFQGSLPAIEGINFHVVSSQFLLAFTDAIARRFRCLYQGDVYGLIRVEAGGGIRTGEVVLSRTRLGATTLAGSTECTRGTLSGTFTVGQNLRIRLL